MAAANKTIWGIHTMDDPLFLNQNLIAIGWEEMGDLSAISTSRDAYKEKYIAAYPDAKKGSIATSAGMLYRFVHEVQEGDYVVFPSKIDRKINIGVVESAYFYEATAALYPNRRKVKWLKHLPRTAFSQGALHEVGSALSFFQVKNYADEYFKALDKDFKGNILEPDTDETVAQTADEIIEATRDFILKELSKKLKAMIWSRLSQIFCRPWATARSCLRMVGTVASTLPPIKMNCRPALLFRSRARTEISKRQPSSP